MGHRKIHVLFLLLLIFTGGILVILNFLNFRSLWLDEAALSLNILEKSIIELTKPLDYNQVAPIGFLIIEKLFNSFLGNFDWSLRVFPVLSFFLSYYLIYRVSLKVFEDKIFPYLTTAFFGTSYYIIYYSAEVKQYMSDTTVCLLILLATINYSNQKGIRNLLPYSIVGVICIWISNISIILLFTSGLLFIYYVFQNRNYLDIVWVLGSWVVSFAFYYFEFIHSHPTQEMMLEYWDDAGAFLPKNILSLEFYTSFVDKIQAFFNLLGYNRLGLLMLPFFGAGVYSLYRSERVYLYLLCFPIILHLFLSYLKVYPFDLRLILYLLPILILICFFGISHIFTSFRLQNLRYSFLFLYIPVLLNLILLGLRGFPTENEEIKASLNYLKDNLEDYDQLYIYEGASLSFHFYEKFHPELIPVEKKNIIYGKGYRENWYNYEKEILKLDDSVWVLFSHVFWKKNEVGQDEEEYIVDLFKKNGYLTSNKKIYAGSSIYYLKKPR